MKKLLLSLLLAVPACGTESDTSLSGDDYTPCYYAIERERVREHIGSVTVSETCYSWRECTQDHRVGSSCEVNQILRRCVPADQRRHPC